MNQHWQPDQSRKIVERHVVTLQLQLVSPAHLGNGDEEDLTDMSLLTDLVEPNRPILTGTSLAGAMRAAVRRWEVGYFTASTPRSSHNSTRQWSHALFGDPVDPSNQNADDQLQSPLIIDDALGTAIGKTEIRDGVRLNPETRTASDQGLYNGEFWQAGTTFDVRLELAISQEDDAVGIRTAFAVALQCLDEAESHRSITIGARKRRGFGVVKAMNWKYRQFDMRTKAGLREWLLPRSPTDKSVQDIIAAISASPLPPKKGREFTVSGPFLIDGSLLIRSGSTLDDLDVDMVHLHSVRNGSEVPILSGTTLGGALRARCWAIAELVSGSPDIATNIVEDLFGPMLDRGNNQQSLKSPHASRIAIQDGLIDNASAGDERLIQSRVSIDRFAGGALNTALFNEQPIFGPTIDGQSVIAPLSFTIHAPTDAHIGLFLLALKDLATSDLPVGGEIAVGRGLLRLHGTLNIRDRQEDVSTLMIGPNGETQSESHRHKLNGYVTALHNCLSSQRATAIETAGVAE